jgi:hypothetical protein
MKPRWEHKQPMKRIVPAALFFLVWAAPVAAQQVATRTWIDSHGTRWTEVTTSRTELEVPRSERISAALAGLPRFGPFVVVDTAHAALVGETNGQSPVLFQAMLKEFPGIRVLEMVDCPGTVDDGANLQLGRIIRKHALITDVPSGGSVRSGAFELFLAGVSRRAAPDAEFGVHAWKDETGRQASDFGADAPANKTYLDYYREMGLTPDNANALYALTNSVPNQQMLWLHTGDLKRFVPVD